MKKQELSIFILMVLSLSLLSCKSPEIEIHSLGKKYPAPLLTGISPFEQDIKTLGFVRMEGICDPRLDDVYLSFDNARWILPPEAPDISGITGLSAGTSNDIRCSDGRFDFFITKTDLLNYWGIDADDDTSRVEVLYLKTSSFKGESQILEVHNTSEDDKNPVDDGGGNGVTEPTVVKLYKDSPDLGGLDQCEAFSLRLESDSGDALPYSKAIDVRLTQSSDGGTSTSSTAIYKTLMDCQDSLQGQTTTTIPSGESQISFYLRMPASGTEVTLTMLSVSSLQPMPENLVVSLQQLPTNFRRLQVDIPVGTLLKGECSVVDIFIFDDQGQAPTNDMGAKINISSSKPTEVQFYNDNTCGTGVINSVDIPEHDNQKRIYVKYVGTVDGEATIMVKGDGSNALSYQESSKTVFLQVPSIERLILTGPTLVMPSECVPLSVRGEDGLGNSLPFTSNRLLTLLTGVSFSGIYTDAACTMGSGIDVIIPSGAMEYSFFYKSPALPNTYEVALSSADLPDVSFFVTVQDPCLVGNPPIGTICGSGAVWLGVLPETISSATNNGGRSKYMIMPSGCDGSTNNPICSGVDTTASQLPWATTAVEIPELGNLSSVASARSLDLGDHNTAIINNYNDHMAAKYCGDMVFGGFDDWYLPSKSELAYVYCKAKQVGTYYPVYPNEAPGCTDYGGKEEKLEGFSGVPYWSSTEATDFLAWALDFGVGNQYDEQKNGSRMVRCIRRF